MPVGLVFVSHSGRIAEGVVELARQMAPDVALESAGGTADGRIGTDAGAVEAAIRRADRGAGVLVVGDLGSAILTAETVVDLLDPVPLGGVRVLDVPIVEGGVAAAVAAQAGAGVEAVARAAGAREAPVTASEDPVVQRDERTATVVLVDPQGLHARPAAELVRLVRGFDARVEVDGADAASLLGVLARGLRQGAAVEVRASGPAAADALAAVVALLQRP